MKSLRFKATVEYKKSVSFYNDFVSLRHKKIDLTNWKADSQILLALVEETPFFTDVELIDYAEMLKRAKESGKPLLIFFTAYADINSRKMEDAFLYDNDIQEYIESNYYSITLLVDSKNEISEEYKTTDPKNGKTMKTYGAFYSKLQEEHFKNQSQPYFAIVFIDGKILRTQGFTMKKKEFKKFLK